MSAGVLVLFVVDRLVKHWVVQVLPQSGFFISFGYVPNAGGVFSIPLPRWLLLAAAVVALAGLVAFAQRARSRGQCIKFVGVALMVIGGASNVLDRLSLGSVTDVFTTVGGLSFNLSDLYLVAGLLLLAL